MADLTYAEALAIRNPAVTVLCLPMRGRFEALPPYESPQEGTYADLLDCRSVCPNRRRSSAVVLAGLAALAVVAAMAGVAVVVVLRR